MALIARPDATAMLEGMAAALVEAVGPELTTDYARSQLASAVTLLRYLAGEFDGAAQSRLEEIAEVEETLAGAAPALIAAGAGDLAGRLTALLAEPAADARLSTL
ncbi:MAG: hypothetical protein FJZ92_08345, partial [Chloroflexi bacterium]|nr:hypothetical protein [Chloroflexota bacterium]